MTNENREGGSITRLLVVILLNVVLNGCSTSSKDITATYTSPLQYQSYTCEQLASETLNIQARTNQIGARLDEASSNDKVITGVGVVLFWPALFALGGTKQQEAEYARLKGEYDAVQQQAIMKKCKGIVAPSPVVDSSSTKKVSRA